VRPKPPAPPASLAQRLLGVFGVLALTAFLLALGRTVQLLSRSPLLNGDTLSYMALALEWREKDPHQLHERTYELARAELSPQVFEGLTAAGAGAERFHDVDAFRSTLPPLRAQVLYTILLSWLHQLGNPLSAATWWISLAAYAMLALLALAWCVGHVPLGPAALLALGIALAPPLLAQANRAGADGLAALFVCLGAFFLVERRLFAFGAAILTLAMAAREDTLLLVVALAFTTLVCLPREQRPMVFGGVLWVALSSAAFVGLQRFSGEPGWWARFTAEFVAEGAQPSTAASAFDWNLYREVLARQLATLSDGLAHASPGKGGMLVLVHAGLALVGVALGLRRRARHGREAALLAALVVSGVVRFLLWPRIDEGSLLPFYVLVPLALLAILMRELRGATAVALAHAAVARRRR
jgi:hypothetical protein